MTDLSGVEVRAPQDEPRQEEILTPAALAFVADLQRMFGATPRRADGGRGRSGVRDRQTGTLDFLAETAGRPRRPSGRSRRRRSLCRTAGSRSPARPTRKMAINALNSGAKVWLADLEDANTPHWANVIEGQVIAVRRAPPPSRVHQSRGQGVRARRRRPGRPRRPSARLAPDEKHVLVDGSPLVGALLDFGLYFFHNAEELLDARTRPLLLPAEDGEPPRGAAVERRLHPRAGRARHPASAPSGRPC